MDDGKSAVLAISKALDEIREQWNQGDLVIGELTKNEEGGSDENESILQVKRKRIREAALVLRRELIPRASLYLDEQLKSDIRSYLELVDPIDSIELAERWRLSWSQLELDARLNNLIAFIDAASRNTTQTRRMNMNRRPGEERILPDELGALHHNPTAIRECAFSIANLLPQIRDTWVEGDELEGEWRLKKWSVIGDTFLSAKREARWEVDRLLNKITNDYGLVVFPHLDSDLRKRMIRFFQMARPDELTNVHGDNAERWHLRWKELNLDDDIVILGMELRAFGDSHVLSKQTSDTDTATDKNTQSIDPTLEVASITSETLSKWAMTTLSAHIHRSRITVRKWAIYASIPSRLKGQKFTKGELSRLADAASALDDSEASDVITELVDNVNS